MASGQPHERDHIGRTLRTLEQCALHRRSLRLTCRRCRSVGVMDAVPFGGSSIDAAGPTIWRAPRRASPARSARDAGHRSASPAIEVDRDQPEGPQPSYPDERKWKRLVPRYREDPAAVFAALEEY